jgi:formate transporter
MQVSPVTVPGRDPRSSDAYTPAEVALRVRTAGVEDARRGVVATLWLAMIGGGMLAIAASASTATFAGTSLAYGPHRVLAGVVFGLGLTLVMVGGGELFTSNNLISMAWVSRQVRTVELVRNWGIVYVGNLIGAASVAVLQWVAGAYGRSDHAVGQQALLVAIGKTSRGFEQDVALGVLGNVLVCLAVWLCFSARSTTDRILCCVLPMVALVTLNVDHVVANTYYLTAGLLLRLDPASAEAAGVGAAALERLTPTTVLANLAGVTVGNVIGGSVLVAAVYWFVYLRTADRAAAHGDGPPTPTG